MNIIYKYKIPISDAPQTIMFPEDAEICDINQQNNEIYLWALIDTNAPFVPLTFKIYGTGEQIANIDDLYYLKTVHMPNGLVWHIFQV